MRDTERRGNRNALPELPFSFEWRGGTFELVDVVDVWDTLDGMTYARVRAGRRYAPDLVAARRRRGRPELGQPIPFDLVLVAGVWTLAYRKGGGLEQSR